MKFYHFSDAAQIILHVTDDPKDLAQFNRNKNRSSKFKLTHAESLVTLIDDDVAQ